MLVSKLGRLVAMIGNKGYRSLEQLESAWAKSFAKRGENLSALRKLLNMAMLTESLGVEVIGCFGHLLPLPALRDPLLAAEGVWRLWLFKALRAQDLFLVESKRPQLLLRRHAVNVEGTLQLRGLVRLPADLEAALAGVQAGDAVTDVRANEWNHDGGQCKECGLAQGDEAPR